MSIQNFLTQSSVVCRRSGWLLAIAISSVLLNGCSNGFGQSLQRSLSADPQLEENADQVGAAALGNLESCPPELIEQLPEDFPAILCYPNGELAESQFPESPNGAEDSPATVQTSWSTPDSKAQVLQFYQAQLEGNSWEITNPAEVEQALKETGALSDEDETAEDETGSASGEDPEAATDETTQNSSDDSELEVQIEAVKEGDRATIILSGVQAGRDTPENQAEDQAASQTNSQPDSQTDSEPEAEPDSETITEFTVEWQSADLTNAPSEAESEPSEPDPSASTRSSTSGSSEFSDLDEAPDDLEPYLRDLAQLSVLTPASNADGTANSNGAEFAPNASVDRRTYARWLFETNNELYGDRPARKIRAATESAQPVFSDVPTSDPDFEVIQGLAEAGLIPSALTGTSTQVSFRPDAPLTREALLTWKVPLDIRGTLPTATVNAVEETWGFQDANRINPNALKAVLADYQNGDNANVLRAFGYTTLFQPQKAVTRAEAAATLWYFGYQGEGLSVGEVTSEN